MNSTTNGADHQTEKQKLMSDNSHYKEMLSSNEAMMKMVGDLHVTVVGTPLNPHSGLIYEMHSFKKEVKETLSDFSEQLSQLKSDKQALKWVGKSIGWLLAFFGIANWQAIYHFMQDQLKR